MINLSVFETKAVIIKTQDYRENDKLVWFYAEGLGKITAIVRGAKKSKSKFLSLTLPLCYGEYMVYNEHTKTTYFLDFYIEDNNKVIEFDGDYWHGEKRGN